MNKKTLFAVSASAVLLLAAGQVFAVAYAPGAMDTQQVQGNMMQGSQTMLNTNPQNMGYKMMSTQPLYAHAGRTAIWFGLMSVITIVLVWIVLIQLIFVLCHWLKKHKH